VSVFSHTARALALAWVMLHPVTPAAGADITLGAAPPSPATAPDASGGDSPWQRVHPGGDGGWLPTFLDEAGLHEEAFNLPAAMHRYRQGCELLPPAGAGEAWWADRQAACEGYADAAFALEDWTGLDEALSALLAARPDHPFPAARFPPLVIRRATEIRGAMASGELRVVGPPQPVVLDGRLLGVPPLGLAAVPEGRHHLRCGDRRRGVEIDGTTTTEVRCPTPATATTGQGLADVLDSPAWVQVGGPGEGMEPGLWVFQGGARPVGLRVAAPGAAPVEAPERWLQALAKVRTR